MNQPTIVPLKPIPIKDRVSMIFVYYGRIDVKDGAFVVINEVDGEDRERKHIPVGSMACIMLEPGTRISHAAVKLAAVTGTLLIWVGEAGVGMNRQYKNKTGEKTGVPHRRGHKPHKLVEDSIDLDEKLDTYKLCSTSSR